MPVETDASALRAGKRNIFIFGPPGTHKTRFLLGCPKPVWDYDLDNGALSLAEAKEGDIRVFRFGDSANTAANKISIEQHRPQTAGPMLDFIKHLNSIYDLPAEKRPATVAVDGLGRFGEMAMEFALALNSRKEPVFQDWGQAMAKIREMVECGVGLPCNFILIAHDQTDRDDT